MGNLFKRLSSNLLDLGLRNKLLNFKEQKLRFIKIIDPNIDNIFSWITSNKALYFKVSQLEINEDPNHDYSQTYLANYHEKLNKYDISAYKKHEKLLYILKNLKKFNDSALLERGINILYLALNFMVWEDIDNPKTPLKSPLLLIPVNLSYDKNLQKYYLRMVSDEVIVNPVLKAKLQLSYSLDLPEYDNDKDDNISYINKINRIIKMKNWSLLNEIYLGVFSFEKLTMYQDLKENENKMESSSLIRALYNGESGIIFNNEFNGKDFFKNSLDVTSLHNVVDADSSQLEAIAKAKNGDSFVIQGPPGTGKSQTITNIISEMIYQGKRVLFVSEKLAALNIVYSNLKKAKLDDFIMKIHSDKENKKNFVYELYRSYKAAKYISSNREKKLEALLTNKEELDNYDKAIHRYIPKLEMDVYSLISKMYESKIHLDNYEDKKLLSLTNNDLKARLDALHNFANYPTKVRDDYWNYAWYGFKGDKHNTLFEDNIIIKIKEYYYFVNTLKFFKDKINTFLDIDLSTYNKIDKSLELLKTIKKMPFIAKDIYRKERLNFYKKTLEIIYFHLKRCLETRAHIESLYYDDIYLLDIERLNNDFHNKYKTHFRFFNSSYRKDMKMIKMSLRNKDNKLNYESVKDLISKVYLFLSDKCVLDLAYQDLDFLKDNNLNFEKYSLEEIKRVLDLLTDISNNYDADINYLEKYDYSHYQELNKYIDIILNTMNDKDKHERLYNYFEVSIINFKNGLIDEVVPYVYNLIKHEGEVDDYSRFYLYMQEFEKLGILDFYKTAINNGVKKSESSDAFSYIFYKEHFKNIYLTSADLRGFDDDKLNNIHEAYKKLDTELFDLNQKEIKAELFKKVLDKSNKNEASNRAIIKEFSLIEHEANKKRQIKPIRTLFKEASNAIRYIKPCLLMSPLSVATYLEYDENLFDVLIFDEASQIFPWDAIGSIARSKQIIVSGDSKQMPPSNFFQTSNIVYDDEYLDEEEENINDYESILDLATAVLPDSSLNWHYRSRNESLITFSNHHFYDDKLITFPSSLINNSDFGLDFEYVSNGTFINRINYEEGLKVVDMIYEHYKNHPERSLGVVAFSISQQQLIEDLLDVKRKIDDRYAPYFNQEIKEPFFIKNLETVQGDERDTIIFSIGYAKDNNGILKHNFGPLNRKGGERRLNVAITRAKYNVKVVSSIRGMDIDLSKTNSLGASLLKSYLEAAEKGVNITSSMTRENNITFALEEDIKKYIKSLNYDVDTKVGYSDYRIDLCVKHPKYNNYVLAIECDGENYHKNKNTRDRERLRENILGRLGWKYHRIYSLDWLLNNNIAKAKLVSIINRAINDYDDLIAQMNPVKVISNNVVNYNDGDNLFYDELTYKERYLIDQLNDDINNLNYRFIRYNNTDNYGYCYEQDINNKINDYWFYFSKNNGDLLFNYILNPGANRIKYEGIKVDLDDTKSISYTIKSLIKDRFGFKINKNRISIKNTSVLPNLSLKLYENIVKEIKGIPYNAEYKQNKVIKDVVNYLYDDIINYAISRRLFKSKDDFYKNKNTKIVSYNFHGIIFDFDNLNPSIAKTIYDYYKANALINVVRHYENMFSETIIINQKVVMEDFKNLIAINDVNFSRASGMNDNFQDVPNLLLIDKLKSFIPVEN